MGFEDGLNIIFDCVAHSQSLGRTRTADPVGTVGLVRTGFNFVHKSRGPLLDVIVIRALDQLFDHAGVPNGVQIPVGRTATRGVDVISTDLESLDVKGLADVTEELAERQHGVTSYNIQEPYVIKEVEGLLNLGGIQGCVLNTLGVVRNGSNLKYL